MSTAEAELPEPSALRRVYRRNRKKLTITYGLVVVEEIFELLYPFTIGIAINGLLDGEPSHIIPFIGIWAAHTIVGIFRQMYDTRVFTGMYAELASTVVAEQRARDLPPSTIIARSTLSREFVDFAETQVPAILSGVLALVGSFVMLLFYDERSAMYCAVLLVPLIAVNWWYIRRSYRLNVELNDQQEREVTVLTEQDHTAVRRHYGLLRKWEIKLSDAEARNWGILEIFVIVLSVFVFFRTTSLPGIEAGTIYAIISYLRSYVESLDEVPDTVQQITRLVDIARRIRPGSEDVPGEPPKSIRPVDDEE
ncbi:MAG: ABC transporter six-transmembrane domain-containing protein [Actinomycetota bacterium]|nr:ABC transporter six-transmembrane domain-containing protein [Actinomycetota bacterium]